MSLAAEVRSFFQVGGTLDPVSPSYVERAADRLLFDSLISGLSCSVFDARQMGKSSLQLRTRDRLLARGARCGLVDLSRLGGPGVRPETWIASIAAELWRAFALDGEFLAWWKERETLTPLARLDHMIVTRVAASRDPAFLFIDEIDSVLALPFPVDEFFGWLRSLSAADRPQRIVVALFGVVTPSDLMRTSDTTPFNIGRSLPLGDFSFDEAAPLAEGLAGLGAAPDELLAEVMKWTGGQPFLTQKLCRLVALAGPGETAADARVKEIVRDAIIANWEQNDDPEHLRSIRNRLLRKPERAPRLLSLYLRVLTGRAEFSGRSEENELLVSGIAVRDGEHLRVRNPVYRAVFNPEWVERQLAAARPWAEALTAWAQSGETDSSRLLRGTALVEALEWSRGRSLPDVDHRFLRASQEADSAAEERAREAERNRVRLQEREHDLARQRRRTAALASALGVAALLAAVAMWQGWEVRRSQQRAVEQERRAEEVSNFVIQLFRLSDPAQTADQLSAVELLESGAAKVDALKREPLTQARVMATIGSMYMQLGRLDEAERFLRDSLSIRRRAAASSLELSDSMHRLGTLMFHRRADAAPLLREALTIRERELGSWHPDVAATLNVLATSRAAAGDLAGAEPLFRRALAIRERNFGSDHADVAQSLQNLAGLEHGRGNLAASLDLGLRALKIRERMLPASHPDVAGNLEAVGMVNHELGRASESLPYLERAVAMYEHSLGSSHPKLGSALSTLGSVYADLGRNRDAEQTYRRALAIFTATRGQDHPSVADTLVALAGILTREGRLKEAAPLLGGALAIRQKGSNEKATRNVAATYVKVLQQLGRGTEARGVARTLSGTP